MAVVLLLYGRGRYGYGSGRGNGLGMGMAIGTRESCEGHVNRGSEGKGSRGLHSLRPVKCGGVVGTTPTATNIAVGTSQELAGRATREFI